MALSFIGAFGALLVVAGINIALAGRISLPLLLAPFGASATLLFVSSAHSLLCGNKSGGSQHNRLETP